MKRTFVGLFIILFSTSALATATPQQISRAQAVLKQYVLPQHLIRMTSAKLNTYMKEITYNDLRPRDILRLAVDVNNLRRFTGKSFVDSQFEGFVDTKGTIQLRKGDFLRVVQRINSNDVSFSNKSDFKGVEGSTIEVADLTLVKLDKNFEPVGDTFSLIARGGLDRKITEFERFDGGFMTQNPSLSFSRASVNDIIVNAEAVNTGKEIIPAFSAAIIIKAVATRIPWTISNYDYVFRLHLINCPQNLQAQKCEVEIKGTKMYANPIWAHYTMPENRREIRFLGTILTY
jgi:hypothetical protein